MFGRQRNLPHKRRGGKRRSLSRNNPGFGETRARVLRVSDLLPPRPAAPFKAFAAVRPTHWGTHGRRLAGGGEWAGRPWRGLPTWGQEEGAWGA